MPDPERIKVIVDHLNSIHAPGQGSWNEVAGYHLVPAMEVRDSELKAIPNSAIPVKMFMNIVTGEMKSYWPAFFDTDFGAIPTAPSSTTAPTAVSPVPVANPQEAEASVESAS